MERQMAEVLVKFSEPVRGGDGRLYWAQACGGVAADGLWEGWLEFESDGAAMRSARETEQPKRDDLVYWAQGLTMTYLQGSLERARRLKEGPVERPLATRNFLGKPRFERPALPDYQVPRAVVVEPRAILDPFAVYGEGETILRQQLNALSRDQLTNIMLGHRLDALADPNATRAELADAIVRAVASSTRVPPDADTEAAQGHA
jgi:hypothetical protein